MKLSADKIDDGVFSIAKDLQLTEPYIVDSKDVSAKNETEVSYSEALAKIKFGRFNYILIIISGMVCANVLMEYSAISFVLPIAECDLHMTNKDKGFLGSMCLIGIILSSPVWGFLGDTKGRRTIMIPTLLIGFIATVFSCFAPNFWIMAVLRFINGVCISAGSGSIFAFLGEFHSEKIRSRALMAASFITGLGAIAVPVLGLLIINQPWSFELPFLNLVFKPWRLYMFICGLLGFFSFVVMLFIPESPKFLLSIGKHEETLAALNKIYKWNGGQGTLNLTSIVPDANDQCSFVKTSSANTNCCQTFFETVWYQTTPLFNKKYLRTTLVISFIQYWIFNSGGGMYMWYPHVMNNISEFLKQFPGVDKPICNIVNDRNWNHTAIALEGEEPTCIFELEEITFYYSIVMEIIYTCAFAVFGIIINYIGKGLTLVFSMNFFAICIMIAVFLPNPEIASYFYIFTFIVGTTGPILCNVVVDLYPTNLRTTAMGLSLMIGRLGAVIGSQFLGVLLLTHCHEIFYLCAGSLVFCSVLAYFIPKKIE